MAKIISPHDKCFKATMSHKAVAKDFFFHHLPVSVKEIIDLDSLQLQRESFIDNELKLSVSDLLFTANFSNRFGYLYLLVEHQSRSDKLMPFRLVKYVFDIFQRHLKQTSSTVLPVVYPLVFYHGKKSYIHSRDLFDLFGDGANLMREVLFKPFYLIDVTKIEDEELRQHEWSGALEMIMKYIFARDILGCVEKLVRRLKKLEEQGGGTYVVNLLEYVLLSGNEIDQQRFVTIIQNGLSPDIEGKVMTIAEQLRREGRAEGRVEGWRDGKLAGREEGKLEGKLETALNLLKQGMNSEFIVKVTDLPLSKIEQLKESTN